MALIAVNKPFTREQLTELFAVDFPLAEWVSAELQDGEEIETNRYQLEHKDDKGNVWSTYLYMDEDSSTVIAIDGNAAKQGPFESFPDLKEMVLSPYISPFEEMYRILLNIPKRYYTQEDLAEDPLVINRDIFYCVGLRYHLLQKINNLSRGEYTESLTGHFYYNHEARRHIEIYTHNDEIVYVATGHYYVSPEEQAKLRAEIGANSHEHTTNQ